jgi:RNA polymerase sigma-70 factor (ECF subfamily)
MEITANTGLLARGTDRVRVEPSAERDTEFAGLVERQARLMFRVAMSVVRNEADAEDAVQEAFLKLYRTGGWLGMREERAFVAKVVWRCALDRVAGAKRTETDSLRMEDGSEREIGSGAESVEAVSVREGERAELRRLIDGLPEQLRRPLVLSAIEEMTSAEVGVVLGIPEGTVRTRVMRAKSELRKRLTGLGRRG